MKRIFALFPYVLLLFAPRLPAADVQAIDLPTRPGVTQRFVLIAPEQPKAAVILFSGGNGWINAGPDGRIRRSGNFLVRSRQLFADKGLMVAVIDAPSDRQDEPYLSGFRQTPEHVADIKAVIAWLKLRADVPVWLVGTSRGTQSAAYVAVQLAQSPGGPDGLVLTSTVLTDKPGRGSPVPDMDLRKLRLPTLVVHHKLDGCKICLYSDIPFLMLKLSSVARRDLLTFEGGITEGDPCEARGYHGFNGIEKEVVAAIAAWILPK